MRCPGGFRPTAAFAIPVSLYWLWDYVSTGWQRYFRNNFRPSQMLQSVSAVCQSVNKNKQAHLGKDESTGSSAMIVSKLRAGCTLNKIMSSEGKIIDYRAGTPWRRPSGGSGPVLRLPSLLTPFHWIILFSRCSSAYVLLFWWNRMVFSCAV